ncbi:MAG TPA: GNAT family N-acetyltransferase [Bryobacteraceae bacterium]|jgi:GNAT superfamily N-acetyltransferase|nr:GNAT family N-acetyltransferase [Bryobacteraceae bacterium]
MMIRKAEFEDIPILEWLIPESVRTLQARDYSPEQMEGALGTVFGVDRQLIRDGTYFVVEIDSRIVACGGWSRRKTLFGSDHAPGKDDAWLDPSVEPARIRAFFVHPEWARRGIGSLLMRASEEAAAAEGFSSLELVATLTGEPLYRAHGFQGVEWFDVALPNGARLPVVRMRKEVGSHGRLLDAFTAE